MHEHWLTFLKLFKDNRPLMKPESQLSDSRERNKNAWIISNGYSHHEAHKIVVVNVIPKIETKKTEAGPRAVFDFLSLFSEILLKMS